MANNSPKHQHFIPRSYLKVFATKEDDKYFVEAKFRESDEIRKMSISNICVNKNLYTLPLIEGDDRFKLENFYATHVDAIYPEVYRMLVNPNKLTLTPEEREKVIFTCMSLYFRTPKFFNQNTKIIDTVFDYALRNCQDSNGNIKYDFKNYHLDFHISEVESQKLHFRTLEKINFLKDHLSQWHDFVKFKVNAPISVDKIDGMELITSDSPVHIHDHTGKLNNLFANENIIKLPLDSSHYLTIYPAIVDNRLNNRILRSERDSMFGWVLNHDTQSNCIDWIIGSEGAIHAHVLDQENLSKTPPEEIEKIVHSRIQEVVDMEQINSLLAKFEGISTEVINKATEIRDNPLYKNNKEMQKLAFLVLWRAKQSGFIIP